MNINKKIETADKKIIKESIYLLDSEIQDSIFFNLSESLKYEYIKKFIEEKSLYFYGNYFKGELIGCALLAENPSEYLKSFKSLNYKIIFHLIKNLSFITLINILFVYFKIDIFFLDNNKKIIINKNINLNLIAIKSSFQSKGLGSFFLEHILNDFKKKKKNSISLEANNIRSISFYKKKMKFTEIGYKIRLFKKQTILMRDF